MKYLKYLLYLVIVLLICFLLIGVLVKKVEYSSEVTVNKPLKESWAVYQDESKMSEWLEGFESIELVSGNKYELGSEYLVKMNQGGQNFEIKEKLIDFKEFEFINFDFDNEMMLMNYITNFEETEGTTIISSISKVEGKGILMKGMMPFIKGSMISQEEKNLNALKKIIEENKTDYFPIIEEQKDLLSAESKE